jgi:hypothetical protein
MRDLRSDYYLGIKMAHAHLEETRREESEKRRNDTSESAVKLLWRRAKQAAKVVTEDNPAAELLKVERQCHDIMMTMRLAVLQDTPGLVLNLCAVHGLGQEQFLIQATVYAGIFALGYKASLILELWRLRRQETRLQRAIHDSEFLQARKVSAKQKKEEKKKFRLHSIFPNRATASSNMAPISEDIEDK